MSNIIASKKITAKDINIDEKSLKKRLDMFLIHEKFGKHTLNVDGDDYYNGTCKGCGMPISYHDKTFDRSCAQYFLNKISQDFEPEAAEAAVLTYRQLMGLGLFNKGKGNVERIVFDLYTPLMGVLKDHVDFSPMTKHILTLDKMPDIYAQSYFLAMMFATEGKLDDNVIGHIKDSAFADMSQLYNYQKRKHKNSATIIAALWYKDKIQLDKTEIEMLLSRVTEYQHRCQMMAKLGKIRWSSIKRSNSSDALETYKLVKKLGVKFKDEEQAIKRLNLVNFPDVAWQVWRDTGFGANHLNINHMAAAKKFYGLPDAVTEKYKDTETFKFIFGSHDDKLSAVDRIDGDDLRVALCKTKEEYEREALKKYSSDANSSGLEDMIVVPPVTQLIKRKEGEEK